MNELFKEKGIKVTRQRKEIYNIVKANPSTIKEILKRKTNDVDVSTLYRIIDLFIKKGIFIKNVDAKGDVYYTLNEEHVHYINCIKCHKKEKIDLCPIDDMAKSIKKETVYTLVSHNMMLDGICEKCADKQKKKEK